MAAPLLKTKLYIPHVRPGLVPRPRLLERLNEGTQSEGFAQQSLRFVRKLKLISAPAGFGKTTLLANWINQTNRYVAWLSLDAEDNDPVRFWSYLIAALQTVRAGIGQADLAALQSPQPPPIESVLTGLMNEIADADGDWVLVLDDFHVITEPDINRGLVFLLDHLPPQMHLILATRADPPWPLARLRARGRMTELRTEDLRFTAEEASTFLNEVMGLALSTQDIATLDTRTEGWIAGLQLAALSMQGRGDAAGFVQAFSGSHRFVLDYLVEEVLDRQPEHIRDFLLKTSILERLSASLCDAILDADGIDSKAILTHLEQNNLFLVPLDDERRWYRYHHLFADLLRIHLKRAQPDLAPILHLRASQWYEASGLISEAIEHTLTAGNVERLIHLVEYRALSMIYHGELRTLIGWLGTLPKEVVRAQPWLCIAYAWALAYAGELAAAEEMLVSASGTDAPSQGGAEDERLLGHAATIRGYCAMLRGDTTRARQLAREALHYLPEKALAARGFAALILGTILGMGGDAQLGDQLLSQALSVSRSAGDDLLEILTLCELAGFKFKQGWLHDAAAACQEALLLSDAYARRSGQTLPAAGFAHIRLAMVLYEWNEVASAIAHTGQAILQFKQWGQKDGLLIANIFLAHLRHAVGDLDGALDVIREAGEMARELTWYQHIAASSEVWLHLVHGVGSRNSLLMASRWVEENRARIEGELDVDDCSAYVQWARILLALGREYPIAEQDLNVPLEEMLRLLARLLPLVEEVGALRFVIKTLVLQTVAMQEAGRQTQSQAALWRALVLAEPEGYIRSFVEEGPPMESLLLAFSRQDSDTALESSTISHGYVQKLLDAFADSHVVSHRPPLVPPSEVSPMQRSYSQAETAPPVALVETLSARELEVLRLLPTDLSSTEISEVLYISKNTVRSHIGHIYDKLGVHSREEAVQQARALGLL